MPREASAARRGASDSAASRDRAPVCASTAPPPRSPLSDHRPHRRRQPHGAHGPREALRPRAFGRALRHARGGARGARTTARSRSSCSTCCSRTATASSFSRRSAQRPRPSGTAVSCCCRRRRRSAIACADSDRGRRLRRQAVRPRLRRRARPRAGCARRAGRDRSRRDRRSWSSTTASPFARRCGRARSARLPASSRPGAARRGCASPPSSRPSAIVVDGVMPGIDGATVIRRMRLDAALRADCRACCSPRPRTTAPSCARSTPAQTPSCARTSDLDVILARLAAMLRSAGDYRRADAAQPARAEARSWPWTTARPTCNGSPTRCARTATTSCWRAPARRRWRCSRVQPVDCILLDLLMPGLGGEETCRRIKASPDDARHSAHHADRPRGARRR